jgi:putative hydrolase of the HAD superfamily
MIQQACIKPQETLFLDDGENNVKAAEKLGIHTLHVKENQDWMPLLTEQLNKLNK